MIEANTTLLFQRFGSADSLDIDCMVFVSQLPETTMECAKLCMKNDAELSRLFPDKKVNSNLGVVAHGFLVEVFKGAIDETNNSMFRTFSLHKQLFENQITKLVERNVELKLHRASRIILSYLSRTNKREQIKWALNGNIHDKIEVLQKLSLTELDFSSIKIKNSQEDIYKIIAFQIGQSLALLEGKEIYTKQELTEEFPKLSPYMNRITGTQLSELDAYFTSLGKKLVELQSTFLCENESKFYNKQ